MNLGEEVENPDRYFYLASGTVLKSIKELAEALKTMDQWVFEHHVNLQKNDFSNWIRDVYNAEELSKEIESADSKKMIELLEKNLKKKEREEKKKTARFFWKRKKEKKGSENLSSHGNSVKEIDIPKKKINVLNFFRFK